MPRQASGAKGVRSSDYEERGGFKGTRPRGDGK